jgi:hypothetical protein
VRYNAVLAVETQPTFRRDVLAPSSSTVTTGLQAGFLLGSFFDPENEGDMFLRNVD